MDSLEDQARVEAVAVLSQFRRGFYDSLTRRGDALFELTDAVLCADGPVTSLPELSLAPVFRRGHGALYDALAEGSVDIARLRRTLAGLDLPRDAQGRLWFGVDVTPWPRPDAECSPGRGHCWSPCRCDGTRQTIPGWPYQVVAALERGRSSWTAPLDVVRLGPDDDPTEVTAQQLRDLVGRLRAAGHLHQGDPPILVVLDAGYDIVRLAWLLADLPVHLLGRIRADRVFRGPAPAGRRDGRPGRPPRHGDRFAVPDPATHRPPDQQHHDTHARYGAVRVRAWGRLHPELDRRGGWAGHRGVLPIVEGTVINVTVDRLPGDRAPKPLWLWSGQPDAATADLDLLWRAYLRRFDLEHTFRLCKQTLGWTRPRVRTPEQADRWTWLLIAAYTQLRLARHLTDDLRRPWEQRATPRQAPRLSPGRVRRGFPRIHASIGLPAKAPKPSRPGPGRPKGRTSTPAPRHPVGRKTPKADTPQPAQPKQTG